MYNKTNLAEKESGSKSKRRIDPSNLTVLPAAKTANVKVMKLNTSDLVSIQPYQRLVDQKKIATIVSNFDIHKFGVPKVSYRDGKYYVYDGQHRVIAYKTLYGDGVIECEVHFGLTYEDEARLFAQQYDGATRVDVMYKWNALFEAKDPHVYSVVNAVRGLGIDIAFTKAKAPGRIVAVESLDSMWNAIGEAETLRVLRLIYQTWPDNYNTFDKNVLNGMKIFFQIYKQEISDAVFIKQMRKIEPLKITVKGKSDLVSQGALKYAKVIWDTYNYGLRKKLDYKFKG